MRDVYFVRHGKAAADAPGGDPARPLTVEGRAGITDVARALRAFGVAPDAIWHSPYLRAQETAAILAGALEGPVGGNPTLVEQGVLVPMASAERAAQAVVESTARKLVVVSHLPLLPALLGELVGARVEFGTGTVAHIAALGPHGSMLLGLWPADRLAQVR